MTRRALITGITGQDGSYLAELLLSKGYTVIGMVRRSSTVTFERIAHLQDRIEFVPGDLLDEGSMINMLREHRPDELYNLAAQSFVQTSWGQPVLTGETTALGVTRALDAIRTVDPGIRFYQASSSEMFGKVREVPQHEDTPFYPRSPYGVAKVYGHWITVNYRESYDLHASSGILFNHESVTAETPVVIRRHGLIDVLPMGELFPDLDRLRSAAGVSRVQCDGEDELQVWDGSTFVPVLARSAYWRDGESVVVHGRGGVIETTPSHVHFTPDGEVEAERLTAGDRIVLAGQPSSSFGTVLTEDEAFLLGVLVAEGHVRRDGHVSIVGHDDALLAEAGVCWERVTGGAVGKAEGLVELTGHLSYGRMLRAELYLSDDQRRVPKRVLNASSHLQRVFLDGYLSGNGGEWRVATTTSTSLAAALVWLSRTLLDRPVAPVLDPTTQEWRFEVGDGLRKPQDEVRRVEPRPYVGWMCDLATPTERYAAGVGFVVTHNSPRRGLEFVTRKISHSVAQIKLGKATELRLGNLDAQRDWGFAGDYVEAMYLMLQQDQPDDFVVSTNETHSVREFCEVAFGHAGLDWEQHVKVDERFMRPAEVDLLIGDSTKARTVLGWKPKVGFEELVTMMVDADLALLSGSLRL